MCNIQLRVHRSGRETSCAWHRLGSAVYRRRFSYRFKPRALRRMSRSYKGGGGVEERDMTDVDEEELEEKQDPRVRTTSSARILKLPNRFY